MPTKLPSIRDVAQKAGVSPSTVSAVFTERVPVRSSTRRAVLTAVEELNYRPHPAARALRVGWGTTIAFAVMEVVGATVPSVISSALSAAGEHGYDLALFDLANDPAREPAFQDRLVRSPTRGAIAYTFGANPGTYREAMRRGVALTFIDQRPSLEQVDFVSTDGRLGVARVVDHLVALGRRRIAILAGPQGRTIFRDRLDGHRDAVEAHALEFGAELVHVSPSTAEAGSEGITELFAASEPPDAIYAASSQLTLGAYRALRQRGICIPDDVALVGTGGAIEWADLVEPPLTVLELPSKEIGRRAVDLVLDRMEHPGQPGRSVRIEPSLKIRGSCGASSHA